MEEEQVTLQNWLNILMSRRSSVDSKVNFYFGGSISLFILAITLDYLLYFETGNVFIIGFTEEKILAIPLYFILFILFYVYILELFRLSSFNNLINKIIMENKTDLEYIKKKYQLIEEMFESLNITTYLKNYELIKEE